MKTAVDRIVDKACRDWQLSCRPQWIKGFRKYVKKYFDEAIWAAENASDFESEEAYQKFKMERFGL